MEVHGMMKGTRTV